MKMAFPGINRPQPPTGPQQPMTGQAVAIPHGLSPADILAASGHGMPSGALTLMMGRPAGPDDIMAILRGREAAGIGTSPAPGGPAGFPPRPGMPPMGPQGAGMPPMGQRPGL